MYRESAGFQVSELRLTVPVGMCEFQAGRIAVKLSGRRGIANPRNPNPFGPRPTLVPREEAATIQTNLQLARAGLQHWHPDLHGITVRH